MQIACRVYLKKEGIYFQGFEGGNYGLIQNLYKDFGYKVIAIFQIRSELGEIQNIAILDSNLGVN